MTITGLPPQVAQRLSELAQTLPPEQLVEVARELRRRMRAEQARATAATYDLAGPGALAVALGQQQRPHLALLDQFHIRAAAGEAVRAIVALPPRVGKTERLLKVGTAWRLNRDPHCRVMQISGGKSLVEQSSRWVRDELERPDGGYRYHPRRDVRAVSDWKLQGYEGGIFIGSMGSRIIGRGANLLEVDDLLGKPEEAESKVMRDRAWRFLQSAFGRLEPNAAVLIVNSRWHDDDPVGRLLKEQPGVWEYLSIPSIAEAHGMDPDAPDRCVCGDPWLGGHADPVGRAPGEPLWPERYDLPALEERRLLMGRWFWAQHQQRPRRREGGLWREEWISERRGEPLDIAGCLARLTSRTVAVDPSASDDDSGDEAGIVCGGRDRASGDAMITHDLSGTMTPEGWARTALVAAVELEATVVYEQNLTPAFMRRAFATAWEGLKAEADRNRRDGVGYRVGPVIGLDDVDLPHLMPQTQPVRAKVGKELRAGPVAQRYEQRKVVHAGTFPLLEDQQMTWKPTDSDSPDRLDAVVHLITWLGDVSPSTATVETPAGGAVPIGAGGLGSFR
ncbi:MAG: hypothetical protein JWP11_3675 [Frankiales bacterium]|nr:hypothetical protein [Frankiales bacterium]